MVLSFGARSIQITSLNLGESGLPGIPGEKGEFGMSGMELSIIEKYK